jgi:UDP-glucose 4-epimerase
MKKKIIVTGGAGMIGIEICRQLFELGHEVNLFDLGEQIKRVRNAIPPNVRIYYGSIVDLSSLRSAMSDCNIVIHLAALLGVRRSEADKLRCIEINIDGTKNVLDCAVQHRLDKIVFASSSEVYGEPQENPITEETITQGKTVYAITKLAGEEYCKAYSQKYPLDYTILRYFNCYGPYQTAQFVIAKFIHNVMHDRPPLINGDGKQVRSYTYVSDTARATILASLSNKTNGEVLNIGNGIFPISLRELAEKIISIAGKTGKINPEYRYDFENSDRKKEREIFERFCDSSKVSNLLNWKHDVSLVSGIQEIMNKGAIFERWEHLYDEQN